MSQIHKQNILNCFIEKNDKYDILNKEKSYTRYARSYSMDYKKIPMTVLLISINTIIFFILTFQGPTESAEFLLSKGASFVPAIINDGEYYRIVTSMFLHFGFGHLVNNMITLALIGSRLEKVIGSVKFLIIYLFGGLCGNILSMWEDIRKNIFHVSAGASGAVFGIIGGLLYVTIRNRNTHVGEQNLTIRDMVIMVGIMLYLGFTSTGVDNMAHLGGLLSGFIATIILYRGPKKIARKEEWYERR